MFIKKEGEVIEKGFLGGVENIEERRTTVVNKNSDDKLPGIDTSTEATKH